MGQVDKKWIEEGHEEGPMGPYNRSLKNRWWEALEIWDRPQRTKFVPDTCTQEWLFCFYFGELLECYFFMSWLRKQSQTNRSFLSSQTWSLFCIKVSFTHGFKKSAGYGHTREDSCAWVHSCSKPRNLVPYITRLLIWHTHLGNPFTSLSDDKLHPLHLPSATVPVPGKAACALVNDFTEPDFSWTRQLLPSLLRVASLPSASAVVVSGLAVLCYHYFFFPVLSTSSTPHSSLLAHSGSLPASVGIFRGSVSSGIKSTTKLFFFTV